VSLRERVIFLLITLNFNSFIHQLQLSIVTIISLANNDSNKRETETSEIKSQQEHEYHMESRSHGSPSSRKVSRAEL